MRESAAVAAPVLAASFRQVFANLASGVTVIAAYGAAGPLGLTATSRQQFALPGHRMNAACHRAVRQERFATWHG